MRGHWNLAAAASMVLATLAASEIRAEEPARPRAGLTQQQTERATKIAGEALREMRPKAAGAEREGADKREFVVGVEALSEKATRALADDPTLKGKVSEGPKALVTAYRYLDDTTIFAVIDLTSGKTVRIDSQQHARTALSDDEFKEAQALAIVKSDEVKQLYSRFKKRLEVYPQYSQYVPPGETRVHRVVHLHYRVEGHDLSVPKPMVDMTTRQVEIRKPDPPDEQGP